MKTQSIRLLSLVVLSASWSLGNQASATFHLMQIEQVIGGVNGDTTAQAIQLRMRSNSQQFISSSRIRAWDAAGANPVTLIDMTTNVAVGLTGRRVLITTAAFGNYTDIPLDEDFIMTNPIPDSYLSGGRHTFESDSGTNYWSLSWGGTGYTGSNAASTLNDVGGGGNYGPPFAGALPSTTLQALQFTGTATAQSTQNEDDYALTAGAATFVNNADASFALVLPDSANFDGDDDVDGDDFLIWQRGTGGPGTFADGDANHNGTVDGNDLDIWEAQYGLPIPISAISAVPEPGSACLMLFGLVAFCRRCR
jgi:hypothetical protein